jgi:hypothetical protein
MLKNKKKKDSFADFLKDLKKKEVVSPLSIDSKEEKKYFLIVCEGEKTEPNYFNHFKTILPKHALEINVEGQGDNTINIVKKAKELRDQRIKNTLLPNYDEVWAVFDKDDFSERNYNAAIELAKRQGIESGHSNQSFELWYILHFKYLDAALHRSRYSEDLSKILGFKYDKSDLNAVNFIFENGIQVQAIARAKKLEKMHSENTPAKSNPYTRIYVLVERLLKYKMG